MIEVMVMKKRKLVCNIQWNENIEMKWLTSPVPGRACYWHFVTVQWSWYCVKRLMTEREKWLTEMTWSLGSKLMWLTFCAWGVMQWKLQWWYLTPVMLICWRDYHSLLLFIYCCSVDVVLLIYSIVVLMGWRPLCSVPLMVRWAGLHWSVTTTLLEADTFPIHLLLERFVTIVELVLFSPVLLMQPFEADPILTDDISDGELHLIYDVQ